ncbi:MAG TPA: hypothetical protein VK993_04815 [Chthoniobacterales bacterium]|nr:hypothetical protein [Chthoniobacterales bacterium]
MISKATPQFWQHYANLPAEVQRLSDKVYSMWLRDPSHTSLHFKKLAGHDALWSVRIGRQYRALARCSGDLVVWVWIGHHSEYDRLVR